MRCYRFRKPKVLVPALLLLPLLFILACGPAAPSTPVVVEKEVVKEVIKEVPVEKVVEKIVEKKVIVYATPVPGIHEAKVPDWVSIGAKKHFKGVVPILHTANPGFLDLHYGASSTTTLMPSGPRFNQLLQYDPTNTTEIQGDLAKSWQVNQAGDEFIFRLHDARWTDGTPVTADDVVFSLDRMAQPNVTRGRVAVIREFYERGTAKAIDPKTVRMPLKFPSATALGWLAVDYWKMYPKKLASVSQDDFNCCFENSFGSGPWKFKNWRKGVSYEFERNNDYFKNPMPFFDGMKVFVIEDYARGLASLKTRQVMAIYIMVSSWFPKDMLAVQRDTGGRMRFARSGIGSAAGFWFHWNKPPLSDPRVRKAIFIAIDRDEIGQIAEEGNHIRGSFFPPGYATTEKELMQLPGWRQPKDQDVAEAKRLLAQAGFPQGFKLTFNVDQSRVSRTRAELIAAQLKRNLNIEVDLQVQDRATFYKNLRDGTHNMSTIGTGLYFNEPEVIVAQWLLKDTLRNPHNWEHPRVNELIGLQARELNPEKRRGYYREMEQILNQGETHYVPLYFTARYGSYDYRLQNFHPPYHPHTTWKWEHVWLDEDAKLLGPDAPPIE